MGRQSTGLDERWLTLDAGATRVRVAPVVASGGSVQLVADPVVESFCDGTARGRTEQAVDLLRKVGQGAWGEQPFYLGLAWAGRPDESGRGIVESRYGPVIPDLVEQFEASLPLLAAPVLQSDSRAALEGVMLGQSQGSGYALISGTGLGEAYYSAGESWHRDRFGAEYGLAAHWQWQGLDAESWLRASAWNPQPDERQRRALTDLLTHRMQQFPIESLWLGGHFLSWLQADWLELPADCPAPRPMPGTAPLIGVVVMERRRLAAFPCKPLV